MPATAPRRVLHCITTLEPAGAQTQLLDLIARIEPARYSCSIATLVGGRGVAADPSISVLDLSRRGRFDPLSLPRLTQHLRAHRIDIVHTHLVHAGVVGKLAAKLAGVRALVSTRHYLREAKSGSFVYRLEDRLTGAADRVVTVSSAVRDFLDSERIADATKLRLLPNAIDFERFDPARFERPNSSVPVIGTIGRLHAQKGHDVLLGAFAELRRRHPRVRLEIVGDGAQRPALSAMVDTLGLRGSVELVGALPPQEIPARLASWTVFALPSRWEAFGIALLEAMAMELPVVASGVEGILELVEPDVTGLLVSPDDAAALAAALDDLLSHPDRAREMGKEARARTLPRFDLSRAAADLCTIYDELLAPA